jgi:para-nitrobenzyl esterase
VLHELGLSRSNWRRLLDLPAAKLLEVQLTLAGLPNAGALAGDKGGIGATRLGFGPVVDGKVLLAHPFDPVAPGISRAKPLMVGYNHDEFTLFALLGNDVAAFNLDEAGLRARLSKEMPTDFDQAIAVYRANRPKASPADIYIAIRSARFAGTGSIVVAERKAAQGAAPVYAYVLNYQLERTMPGTTHPLGATHGMDISFKFNNVAADYPQSAFFAGKRPQRFPTGRNMSGLWAGFANRCATCPGRSRLAALLAAATRDDGDRCDLYRGR